MKEGLTESITERASELIAQRGVYGMSIGEIASGLDVSKGSIHYYFPSKQAIVAACAKRSIKSIGDALFQWVDSVNAEDDPRVHLESLCDALLSDGVSLRVFIAVNSAIEAGDELEGDIDSAMSEWNVMIEVGSMKLRADAAAKLKRMSAAVLPFICGMGALNADADYAKDAFTALILG